MKNILRKRPITLSAVSFALFFILLIPTFSRMLRPGIYSMQDFPYFRLVEYTQCLKDGQIPCRWAADAGLGFGEPVFNFYSHVPFFFGALLVQIGISAISSLKLLFAFSIVASGFTMYLLSKELWKSKYSAFVSGILYVYAPYRAVNVWVRGALPESFAFIFLPLILFFFEKYLINKNKKYLLGFISSFTALILTHNLSVLLFFPIILFYIFTRLIQMRSLPLLVSFFLGFLCSVLLASFYIFPTVFESSLVNLQTTTQGYFDFRAHFVTIPQLLFSRFWGYGGSTWGDQDGLSLALGQVQWIVALFLIIGLLLKSLRKKLTYIDILAALLIFLSMLFLFFTHNKSAFIWEEFSTVMKYIQFPWRFLGVTLFTISLAGGYLPLLFSKFRVIISVLIVFTAIFFNYSYYHEDIWNVTSDNEMQSGKNWVEQSRASIGDYWPKYGVIPHDFQSQSFPNLQPLVKKSNSQVFTVNVLNQSPVVFPVTYFPGWSGSSSLGNISILPNKDGLISTLLPIGKQTINLSFNNSPVRTYSNMVSFITFTALCLWFTFSNKIKKFK